MSTKTSALKITGLFSAFVLFMAEPATAEGSPPDAKLAVPAKASLERQPVLSTNDMTAALASTIRHAKGTYRAPSSSDLDLRCGAALRELGMLDREPGVAEIPFDLSGLRKQLELGSKTDLTRLEELRASMYRDSIGIERPAFVRLRPFVERYRDALSMSKLPDPAAIFDQTLEETAAWLHQHATNPTAESAYQLGRRLGWLERSGQNLPFLSEIRELFSRPNFHIRVSKSAFEEYFSKTVNETTPVDQVIRDADVRGTATTVGSTHLELVPSDESATLRVVMTGRMTSDVVAEKSVNGPFGKPYHVRIPSNGRSDIRVEKTFRITEQGFIALPAEATAPTSTTFLDIQSSAKWSLVRKKIVSGAYAEKPAGERESSGKAVLELCKRADQVSTPEFMKVVQDGFQKYYLDPQIRVDSKPIRHIWRTTTDALEYGLVRRSPDMLAAPGPPPAFHSLHHIAVSLHQSEANNEIAPFLGGRWISDEQFAEMYKIVFGVTPRPLRLGSHMQRWSIRFDPIRPLQFEFGGDRVSLTLFASGIRIADKETLTDMTVGATYQVRVVDSNPEFIRIGDLRVSADSSAGKLMPDLRAFLRDKFADLFAAKLAPDGLVPPDGGLFDALRTLEISEGRTQDGWALIGLRVAQKPKPKKQ